MGKTVCAKHPDRLGAYLRIRNPRRTDGVGWHHGVSWVCQECHDARYGKKPRPQPILKSEVEDELEELRSIIPTLIKNETTAA